MAYSVLNKEVLARYNVRRGICNAVCLASAKCKAAVTSNCMAAYSQGDCEIRVKVAGTALKLPIHNISDGFLINTADTVFTVPECGLYLISYQINVENGIAAESRVMKNAEIINGLTLKSITPSEVYSLQSIVSLKKGDKLSLVLSAPATVVKLKSKTGAFLNVVRLS